MDNKNEKREYENLDRKEVSFNINLEKILLKASEDEDFKSKLIIDRPSVINDPEFSLNSIDKTVLNAIPLDRLNEMIDKFSMQRTSRRNFLKASAACAALAVTSVIAASCCTTVTGARPEPPVLSTTVGSDGSELHYDYTELEIIIPQGALKESVNITLKTSFPPVSLPEGISHYGEYYEILPDSIECFKDVTLKFPCKDGIKGNVYFLSKNKWKVIQGKVEGNYIVVHTRKFGFYTVGGVEK